jgi:uncharacterized protein YjbI with pentapeptide repeats
MIPDRFYNADGSFHLAPRERTFAGCMMQGADLMFAQVAYADLTGADLYWASCRNANMEGTLLIDCDLRRAVFNEANLRGAALERARLCFDNLGGTTDFHHADLSGANLQNAEIHGAEFVGARLVGADLRGCRGHVAPPERPTRFDGADLTDARLKGARLAGARYDAKTVFPRGFDPTRAGMVMAGGRRKPRR